MEQLLPWLRLQLTPGLGRVGLMRLIERFETPDQAIDNAASWHLAGLRNDLARAIPAASDSKVQEACERLVEMQGRLLTIWDADYPRLLTQISDPPALLYCCGELPAEPALAIVGTRHPTIFGKMFTRELAGDIAAAGIVIVSGMARGIDSAAHLGAIDRAGKTVAVLGCGIDRIYPRENAELYRQIIDHGALLSEYPPCSAPLPGHFPGRNRIISGLSLGTLVVEACRDSGSLITAEFALEQGREVMAVPGGVDRPTSYGPNLLIKQGAHPVTEAEEIIQILGLSGCQGNAKAARANDHIDLPDTAGRVLRGLSLTPRHSDELSLESGLTARALSVILLHLELQGYAEKLPGGRYVRGRRALQPLKSNGDFLRERVLAIVSFIAQYFLDDQDLMTESDLVEELLAVGFEADEIDAAFCWMESQTICSPAGSNTTLCDPPASHRVFSAEENRVLSGDARGFLVRLRSMGIIDAEVQEEVISKALQVAEDEISLKEIKTITVLAMFANSHNEWRREYDCLLEDDWPRLLN